MDGRAVHQSAHEYDSYINRLGYTGGRVVHQHVNMTAMSTASGNRCATHRRSYGRRAV